MALTLVSSGDDRAIAIRDHVVPIVRDRGNLEVQRDAVRLTSLLLGPWTFLHWTPFNEVAPDEAASPGYRHALERQQGTRGLPYGMEVSHHAEKVLSILWAGDGVSEVISFIRGPWEDEALAL